MYVYVFPNKMCVRASLLVLPGLFQLFAFFFKLLRNFEQNNMVPNRAKALILAPKIVLLPINYTHNSKLEINSHNQNKNTQKKVILVT